MRIRKIIMDYFVIPRIERWKLAYSQHFVNGGFDGIQHSPAQALVMYKIVTAHEHRMKLFENLSRELRGSDMFSGYVSGSIY